MRQFILRIAMFGAVVVLVGELFFRFVIPASELPVSRYDPQWKILRYDPEMLSEGIASSGRLAQSSGTWRINAQGWNSHRDYLSRKRRGKPAVAYFGSSFLEGFHSNLRDNVAFVLERLEQGRVDVYNLSMSDSVPSEHLEVARYARTLFAPEAMVFFVSPWHLASTLTPAAGRQRWKMQGNEVQKRPVIPRNTGVMRALAKRSAILRYLILNARMRPTFRPGSATEKPAAGNAAQAGKGSALSKETVTVLAETLVKRAVQENPNTKILFVTGGPHASDTPPKIAWQSALIAQACEKWGAAHLDLGPAFHARWVKEHRRFDFAHDFHWNAYALSIVAEVLHDWLVEQGL